MGIFFIKGDYLTESMILEDSEKLTDYLAEFRGFKTDLLQEYNLTANLADFLDCNINLNLLDIDSSEIQYYTSALIKDHPLYEGYSLWIIKNHKYKNQNNFICKLHISILNTKGIKNLIKLKDNFINITRKHKGYNEDFTDDKLNRDSIFRELQPSININLKPNITDDDTIQIENDKGLADLYTDYPSGYWIIATLDPYDNIIFQTKYIGKNQKAQISLNTITILFYCSNDKDQIKYNASWNGTDPNIISVDSVQLINDIQLLGNKIIYSIVLTDIPPYKIKYDKETKTINYDKNNKPTFLSNLAPYWKDNTTKEFFGLYSPTITDDNCWHRYHVKNIKTLWDYEKTTPTYNKESDILFNGKQLLEKQFSPFKQFSLGLNLEFAVSGNIFNNNDRLDPSDPNIFEATFTGMPVESTILIKFLNLINNQQYRQFKRSIELPLDNNDYINVSQNKKSFAVSNFLMPLKDAAITGGIGMASGDPVVAGAMAAIGFIGGEIGNIMHYWTQQENYNTNTNIATDFTTLTYTDFSLKSLFVWKLKENMDNKISMQLHKNGISFFDLPYLFENWKQFLPKDRFNSVSLSVSNSMDMLYIQKFNTEITKEITKLLTKRVEVWNYDKKTPDRNKLMFQYNYKNPDKV